MTKSQHSKERGRHGLSKSRLTSFEQCPKRLWLSIHKRDEAVVDAASEARFAEGHQVGDIACALCPGGVMVEAEPDLTAALATTRELLDSGHRAPIFEATFERDGVLIRADVLEPVKGGWHMAEVKSSTGVKDYHKADLATQLWVMETQNVKIKSASVRHIDNQFVLEEEGDFDGLFTDAELKKELKPAVTKRGDVVVAARAVLAGDEPDIAPGAQCNDPFACEFADYCNRDLPEGPEWPVSILPNGGWKHYAADGVEDLLALDEAEIRPQHAKIVAATRSGKPFLDAAAASAAMADWSWPRAWLDFETIQFAVPRWIGTRPYQKIAFQFSVHVEHEDGRLEHHGHLDLSGDDPREAIAKALVDSIPKGACILAYSAGFERSVLKELARDVPKYAKQLLAMAEATVDLLPITRAHYYHRDQRGSWSIKSVLPTITDLSYADMDVGDGSAAMDAYMEATDAGCSPERRAEIGRQLEEYCALDTLAMVRLARALVGG